MFKAFGHWFRQRFSLSKQDKAAIAMSARRPSESQMTEAFDAIDVPSHLVPYDENLLERARTQWQFGNWQSLANLDRDTLQHHPDRAKLALLAASGRLQNGQGDEAKAYIRLAQDWGVSKKLVSQILIAGVHNSIGRAAAIGNHPRRALLHCESAIQIGTPGAGTKLFIHARMADQLSQLGITSRAGFVKAVARGTAGWDDSRPLSSETSSKTTDEKYANFSSYQYWEERYRKGNTSGFGSYGRLARFKAQIINKFITAEQIDCVIDFGCGDGNQLSFFSINDYIGVDISPTIIKKCKKKYLGDSGKTFYTLDEFKATSVKGDLSLSMDVIFHLIENENFESYMKILFDSAKRFCIIYSSNDNKKSDPALHVRHRLFTKWIEDNILNWRLKQVVYNKYPHDGTINPKDSSFSNFFFYEKKIE
jgi:hypothetical protein